MSDCPPVGTRVENARAALAAVDQQERNSKGDTVYEYLLRAIAESVLGLLELALENRHV